MFFNLLQYLTHELKVVFLYARMHICCDNFHGFKKKSYNVSLKWYQNKFTVYYKTCAHAFDNEHVCICINVWSFLCSVTFSYSEFDFTVKRSYCGKCSLSSNLVTNGQMTLINQGHESSKSMGSLIYLWFGSETLDFLTPSLVMLNWFWKHKDRTPFSTIFQYWQAVGTGIGNPSSWERRSHSSWTVSTVCWQRHHDFGEKWNVEYIIQLNFLTDVMMFVSDPAGQHVGEEFDTNFVLQYFDFTRGFFLLLLLFYCCDTASYIFHTMKIPY